MEYQDTAISETEHNVLVHVGSQNGEKQPGLFRCCPLGVQFYSENRMTPYSILNFTLSLPDNPGPSEITCSGAVVHCDQVENDDKYRIWLYFLDLPENARSHLHCFAKEASFLCPFCENF